MHNSIAMLYYVNAFDNNSYPHPEYAEGVAFYPVTIVVVLHITNVLRLAAVSRQKNISISYCPKKTVEILTFMKYNHMSPLSM